MKQPENMTLKGTLEQREGRKRAKQPLSETFAAPARWSLLLAVILAPWAFGSVHHWAQKWISVLLLIGLGFWWFETAMNSRRKQVFPYISMLVLGGMIIETNRHVPAVIDAVMRPLGAFYMVVGMAGLGIVPSGARHCCDKVSGLSIT